MKVFKKKHFHSEMNDMGLSKYVGCLQNSSKCKRLQHEHQILLKLNHPYIVNCDIQFFSNEERCCIRLEQAECDFLEYLKHFYMNRNKAFFRTQISLLKNIAQAIDYLHSLDYVHNDIKLENCLLFVKQEGTRIYQNSKQKIQISEQNTQSQSKKQMSSSTTSLNSLNNEIQIPTLKTSQSSYTPQNSDDKNSLQSNQKQKNSSSKGKLILKLADFEFSCSTQKCNTIEYFQTWRMRNKKQMSPELLDLCNLIELTSSSNDHEQFSQSSQQPQNQFKKLSSICCEDQQSVLSTNYEEEEMNESYQTLSTDHTLGSQMPNENQYVSLLKSQEKLQNQIKSMNLKQNDIFCFGVMLFSAMFGVYPFQKEATKSDPIYSLIFEERWKEFWILFENRISNITSLGFSAEQIHVLKDLVQKLLNANPCQRPSIRQILKHPFFLSQPKSK